MATGSECWRLWVRAISLTVLCLPEVSCALPVFWKLGVSEWKCAFKALHAECCCFRDVEIWQS
eukprot:5417132-Amphidinium_carterae.2